MRTIVSGIANVILTFEEEDQIFYNAPVNYVLPADNTQASLEVFEIDVVRQLLEGRHVTGEKRDMSRLVKISVCYNTNFHEDGKTVDENRADINAALDYLCRHNAKYYFQPNQRDDYETLIARALGVAQNTQDI